MAYLRPKFGSSIEILPLVLRISPDSTPEERIKIESQLDARVMSYIRDETWMQTPRSSYRTGDHNITLAVGLTPQDIVLQYMVDSSPKGREVMRVYAYSFKTPVDAVLKHLQEHVLRTNHD